MRWTPKQLEEYEAKRESWISVEGVDTVAESPHKADPGPERALQRKIMAWAKERGYPCFHDRSRGKNQAGWPDCFLYLPKGRHILIELKSAKGSLRPEQKALRRQFKYLGHEYFKLRSWKHFLEIIKEV